LDIKLDIRKNWELEAGFWEEILGCDLGVNPEFE
jgi:hypothetical protein